MVKRVVTGKFLRGDHFKGFKCVLLFGRGKYICYFEARILVLSGILFGGMIGSLNKTRLCLGLSLVARGSTAYKWRCWW